VSVPNVNSVTLVGHVVEEPELRGTPSGLSVCELRLAVNDMPEKVTLYVDVATFGERAEPASATWPGVTTSP
jgi:single-stranded DNA-binding protein